MTGEEEVTECTFVESNVTDIPFFASPVVIGKSGVTKFLPIGELNEVEKKALEDMKSELNGSIQKGIDFVKSS